MRTSAIIFLCLIVTNLFAVQITENDTLAIDADSLALLKVPEAAQMTIQLLDLKNTSLKDIFLGLAKKYNLNIFVSDDIDTKVTVRLVDISVHEAILFLVDEYHLDLNMRGDIYRISYPELPKPEPKPLRIEYKAGLLTIDIKDEPVEKVIYRLAELSAKNIMIDRGVNGKVSGFLQNIEFDKGLKGLMRSNGFQVRERDGIYNIERDRYANSKEKQDHKDTFWIDVQDSLLSLDVMNARLNEVVLESANQMDKDLFILSPLEGIVNAQCSNVSFDNVLNYLFKGTPYTYRLEKDIYFVGDKEVSGIGSTQLIRLNYIKADGILDLIPDFIKDQANLNIIKEHNAVMVMGSQDVVYETESFIKEIDYPIPQILIEAIVVDYNTSDILNFGVTAGMRSSQDTSQIDYGLLFPALDFKASGTFINEGIEYHGPNLGIKNLGKLPTEFYMGLQALETQGKANVRSRPQIATLNGHSATIKIGTTQYYQLESYTPYQSTTNIYRQTSQRFETITAEIKLEITPWVSSSGEITTEIKPEFSTPRNFDPKIPPTIDHRILESTVRLRDGETIVLGGLTQTTDEETIKKLPLLGDIPVLGKLFQNVNRNKGKAELMIYITPHLMYNEDILIESGGTIR